jgi:hypothetical protein
VIERAQQAAIKDALTFIEKHALFTRTGQQGIRQVNVRALVATAFTHRDSRAGDRTCIPTLQWRTRLRPSTAPPSLRSADDVLQTLLGFVDWGADMTPLLVVGHSAGGGKCRLLPPEGATSPRTPSYWIGTTARIDGPAVAL